MKAVKMSKEIGRWILVAAVAWSAGCHEIASVDPDPAAPGGELVISGSGFGPEQGSSVLRYDGSPIEALSWSDGSIVARLPSEIADGSYALEIERRGQVVSVLHGIENPPPEGMVLIPAGEFIMGQGTSGPAAPAHPVYLDAYWIDEAEVSIEEYLACVDDGACAPPGEHDYCNWNDPDNDVGLIDCIPWAEAVAYCEWVGKSLLTEAQWEKAARIPVPADMLLGYWNWIYDWYDYGFSPDLPYLNPTGPEGPNEFTGGKVVRGRPLHNRGEYRAEFEIDGLTIRCARAAD